MITEHQYRRLMNEYQKSGQSGLAVLKASMDRKTAAHYLATGHGPEVRGAMVADAGGSADANMAGGGGVASSGAGTARNGAFNPFAACAPRV